MIRREVTRRSPGELLVMVVLVAIVLQVGVSLVMPFLPWLIAAAVLVLVVWVALAVRRRW